MMHAAWQAARVTWRASGSCWKSLAANDDLAAWAEKIDAIPEHKPD